MKMMQLRLEWHAFVVTTEIPFEHHSPWWSIVPGRTLNILIWIKAAPQKACNWIDLLKTGQPVVFQGINNAGKTVTSTVTANYSRRSKLGHGAIWELSFS
jgi:hypothetical protein